MQYESYVGIRKINQDECVEHGMGAFCFDFDYKNIGIVLPSGFQYIPINRDCKEDIRGWCWDGNIERPTLTPSIRISIGHGKKGSEEVWHGFLTNGIFKSV